MPAGPVPFLWPGKAHCAVQRIAGDQVPMGVHAEGGIVPITTLYAGDRDGTSA
jgi:hypothetical protein